MALSSPVAVLHAQSSNPKEAAQKLFNEVGPNETLLNTATREQALGKLQEVASYWRQTDDVWSLVATLNRIGSLHLKLNNVKDALPLAEEATKLARQTGNILLLIDTLNASAEVYLYKREISHALQLLNEAYSLSLESQYRRGEAQSLTTRSYTHWESSAYQRAVDDSEAAIIIWRELADKRGEARAFYYLGDAHMLLSQNEQSAAALGSALKLWQELGDQTEQASTLIEFSFLQMRQGQRQKGLALLKDAQGLVADEEAEPYMAGQIAAGLGSIYQVYGQLETALEYYEKALRLYRDFARQPAAAADMVHYIGLTLALSGKHLQAIAKINEALRLAEHFQYPFLAARCYEDLGQAYLATEQYGQARDYFLLALSHYHRVGSVREEARTHTFLGQTYYLQGLYPQALKSYRQALSGFSAISDYTNEAALDFGLGQAELALKDLDQAGFFLERSISLTEQLRENAMSKDLRSSFLASVHDRYETYVEWLMQQHEANPKGNFAVTAFETSENGRARALLDVLKNSDKEINQAIAPELLAEEKALQEKKQALLDKQANSSSRGTTLSNEDETTKELQQVNARYEALQAQIYERYPDFVRLLRPKPLSLAEVQAQVLDSETLLLEYSLGQQKSYVWAVTRTDMSSYELPAKTAIVAAAEKVYKLIIKSPLDNASDSDLRVASAELSSLLLGPLSANLNYKRIIIVADGILQYIPFQALSLPNKPDEPLLARYEIVNAPSASTLALARQNAIQRPLAPKLLAALGDPVFPSSYAQAINDAPEGQRLAATIPPQLALRDASGDSLDPTKLTALIYAKGELNVLRSIATANESAVLSSFDATRENLQKLDLSQYRILHFATHGLLNSKQPEFSGLVMSLVDRENKPINGFVTLSDIYNLRAPVDLVVLSACRTALGKDVRGEGLIGLTRGFMYAGASSVAASLWKVDDGAAAELMKRFYAKMLHEGQTPAAALRAAQNSMRLEKEWSSPYYWAAFTIQGEYRQTIQPAPRSAPRLSRSTATGSGVALAVATGLVWWYRRRRRKLAIN